MLHTNSYLTTLLSTLIFYVQKRKSQITMNGINENHTQYGLYNNVKMRVKFLQTFASNWRRFFSSSHSSFSFFFQILFYRFYSAALFSFTRDLRSHCHRQLCRYISILLPPSASSFIFIFVLKQGLSLNSRMSLLYFHKLEDILPLGKVISYLIKYKKL